MPPPLPGQKGTGKKGNAARQSRSRNTTPSIAGTRSSLPPLETGDTSLLDLPLQNFGADDEMMEIYGHQLPSAKDLEALLERLQKLVKTVETRGDICDKGMRLLAKSRKERSEDIENERRDVEQKERARREAVEEEERGRTKAANKKKRKEQSTAREERPLAHGAHTLAPQDGSNLDSSPLRDRPTSRHSRKQSRDNDSASSSLSPAVSPQPASAMEIDDQEHKTEEKKEDVADDDSSEDEHQPPPAPAIPHLQTFGEDPSTFPDPTIYEVLPITDDMDDETKKKIYSVEVWPESDLSDLIPGFPPDKDFSIAKPTNQVQANTFATYLEPYFRPFTEEDLAFLRERGDRVNPFVIPRRGKKHYTEVWAEEDGNMSIDTPSQGRDKLPPNQARGDVGDLNDANAETDQISAGPILTRLLATLRAEHRTSTAEEKPSTNGVTNGEASTNGDSHSDLADILSLNTNDTPGSFPPATFMADSNSEGWKKGTHLPLDHSQVDERIKQELRHIGFLPPDTEPDYDAHYDDEIAARLRYLQERLKEQSIINGARKARLMELTKERMAHQEYTTILEDLDSQVQTAYLKRTRTMGKSKKAKRPGGAGGGSHFGGNPANGMARPGIGDVTKTLMERRTKWIDAVGKVFEDERSIMAVPRAADEGSSIFKNGDMGELMKREKQAWDEEAEED